MKNRDGTEYDFKEVSPDVYLLEGDLRWWRYGGLEGQESIDYSNLGFVDPAGGPFLSLDSKINGQTIKRIWLNEDRVYFDVEAKP